MDGTTSDDGSRAHDGGTLGTRSQAREGTTLNAFVARLQSLWSATRAATDGLELGESEDPRPGLFHCPTCGVVYIAVDKETCSSCETTVESVPSTLTCQ